MSEQLTELEVVHEQPCPMCGKNTLSLTQAERDIPFFGKVYVFSMSCIGCKYHKADIECAEEKDPCKCTLEVDSVDDMNIRIIKSASATVKIPFVVNIESTEASNGYSKHLMYATYALVAATIFLGCTSVLLIIVNVMQFVEGV